MVVGGGISGLSAAHFYRRESPAARILILDNHNEFKVNDRTQIAYGGTESIDTPSGYTDESRALLEDIGIDLQRFYEYFDRDLYNKMDLSYAIAFDEETYGKRKFGCRCRLKYRFCDHPELSCRAGSPVRQNRFVFAYSILVVTR